MNLNREELIKKYGNLTEAAKKMGIPRQTLNSRLKKTGNSGATPDTAQPGAKSFGKNLSDFRATHDKAFIVPKKIKDALRELGKTGWEYESQFAKLAGVSLSDLGDFRDQFGDYIVIVRRDGKRAWAGSPALATQMREMVR